MIKYVYVLVSDKFDYYLEQAMMSIVSLRMYTSNAFVSLLIDDTTKETLKDKRGNILGLVDELKVMVIDSRFNKKARSRWLKNCMRQNITGDFLYIDCDTIISEDLSDIENINADLGAVLDFHVPLEASPCKKYHQITDKILGFDTSFVLDRYYNGGVILCRDAPICYKFFYKWRELWMFSFEKRILIEQPSFNQANFSMGNVITELEGKWNCQILANGAVRHIHDAKILHYITTGSVSEINPYLLADQQIFKSIKKTMTINQEIKNMLANPKHSFMSCARLVVGEFNNSRFYGLARRVFYSGFGFGIEFILSHIHRIIFKRKLKERNR